MSSLNYLNYYREYSEADYRREAEARDLALREQEARDMADYYAGESPEYEAWLNETTPDAPHGAYIPRPDHAADCGVYDGESCHCELNEDRIERARRQPAQKYWAPIDETTAGPIIPEFDFSPVHVPERKRVA